MAETNSVPQPAGYQPIIENGQQGSRGTVMSSSSVANPDGGAAAYSRTVQYPDSSVVAFPDSLSHEDFQDAAAKAWTALKSAVQPYASTLGQELKGAGSEVAGAAKGMATTAFPGQQQLLESLSEVHPVYQAWRQGGLPAAQAEAQKQADAHNMLKQRIQEFHDNPSSAVGRLVADAAMAALPYVQPASVGTAAAGESAAAPKGALWEDITGTQPASTAAPAARKVVAEPWSDVTVEPRPQTRNIGLEESKAAAEKTPNVASTGAGAPKLPTAETSEAHQQMRATAVDYLREQSKGKSLADMSHEVIGKAPEEVAPDADVRAYIKKQYPNATDATLAEVTSKPLSSEELNVAATKAVRQATVQGKSTYTYSKDAGDLVHTHKVDIQTAGKPTGFIKAVALADSPNDIVISRSQSNIPNAKLGEMGYRKLFERAAAQADESGAPVKVSGGPEGFRSPSAEATWDNLADSYPVVRDASGRPSVVFQPKLTPKPVPAAEDITNWESIAQHELSQ